MDQYVPFNIAYLFEFLSAAWVVTDEATPPGLGSPIVLPLLVEHGIRLALIWVLTLAVR